ncbi:hypothetical protein LTR95_005221 [Oleoguttula sp. CCFEE 5521]
MAKNRDTANPAYASTKKPPHVQVMLDQGTQDAEATISSGPLAGYSYLLFPPSSRGHFEILPVELRHMIYTSVFSPSRRSITLNRADFPSSYTAYTTQKSIRGRVATTPEHFCRGDLALLLVNRMIRDEAKAFIYHGREIIFPAMQDFIRWIPRIGSNVNLLTHLTVRKSGANQLEDFYGLLAKIPPGRLQHVQVTLSANFKGTLRNHVTDHWNKGEAFFVGDNVSQVEGRRRVDLMTFTIGPSQKSVLVSNDSEDVMKEISAEDRKDTRKIMKDWIPTYADSKGIKGTRGGQKKG